MKKFLITLSIILLLVVLYIFRSPILNSFAGENKNSCEELYETLGPEDEIPFGPCHPLYDPV